MSFFQSSVETLFAPLRDSLKAWLDNFSLHASNEDILLDNLYEFLRICQTKRLFLSVLKCNLFRTKLCWCGRIVSVAGITLDPARISGLQGMETQKTAEELGQFI